MNAFNLACSHGCLTGCFGALRPLRISRSAARLAQRCPRAKTRVWHDRAVMACRTSCIGLWRKLPARWEARTDLRGADGEHAICMHRKAPGLSRGESSPGDRVKGAERWQVGYIRLA